MAKKQRMYHQHWSLLKQHGKLLVETTNSNDKAVQKNLIRMIRRAVQKEKYLDLAFRATYPNAEIETIVHPSNKVVEFLLNKGMGVNDTTETIFGEATS